MTTLPAVKPARPVARPRSVVSAGPAVPRDRTFAARYNAATYVPYLRFDESARDSWTNAQGKQEGVEA